MKRLLVTVLLCVAGLPYQVAHAATVTISVTPTTGVESVTPTITWTSTGVKSCTATGGWSGAKATSGTETLPAIDRSATYGLICTTDTGGAILSWVAPTQNTNGTALTDLAKYRIYHATTTAALATATPVEINAPASSYEFASLPVGTRFFGVTAVSARGIESVMSNTPTKDVSGETATASKDVEVTPRPKAPVVGTVQ